MVQCERSQSDFREENSSGEFQFSTRYSSSNPGGESFLRSYNVGRSTSLYTMLGVMTVVLFVRGHNMPSGPTRHILVIPRGSDLPLGSVHSLRILGLGGTFQVRDSPVLSGLLSRILLHSRRTRPGHVECILFLASPTHRFATSCHEVARVYDVHRHFRSHAPMKTMLSIVEAITRDVAPSTLVVSLYRHFGALSGAELSRELDRSEAFIAQLRSVWRARSQHPTLNRLEPLNQGQGDRQVGKPPSAASDTHARALGEQSNHRGQPADWNSARTGHRPGVSGDLNLSVGGPPGEENSAN